MITYIELWKAKQTWMNLSKEERNNYTAGLGPAIQQLLNDGVQIVSWGYNDTSTYNRTNYDFFAVWTFPDIESTQKFEELVESVGWYNYFDQVNAKGTTSNPQEVIEKMLEL